MKVIFNALYYLIVAAIVLVAVLLFATVTPIPGNIQAKVVKSGSMEPSIKTGDLVVIAPSQTYEIGDVITFGPDTATQIPTTHRIVSVSGSGESQTFVTQGDANEEPDPITVNREDVSGKVVVTVPYLGYVLDFARTPLGFILLVGVPAGAIILEEISKIAREVKLMRNKKLAHATEDANPKRQDAQV